MGLDWRNQHLYTDVWQRLPHLRVTANLTVLIGIMGSNSLVFLDWGYQCFRKKKRKYMSVLFPSDIMKHLHLQSSTCSSPLPIIPFNMITCTFTLLQDNFVCIPWGEDALDSINLTGSCNRSKNKVSFQLSVNEHVPAMDQLELE